MRQPQPLQPLHLFSPQSFWFGNPFGWIERTGNLKPFMTHPVEPVFFLYLGIFGFAVYAPCVTFQHQEDTNSGRFLDPVNFIAAGAQRLVRLFGMPLNYSKWGNSGLGLEIIRIRYDGFYTIWRHIFACSFMFIFHAVGILEGFWWDFSGVP